MTDKEIAYRLVDDIRHLGGPMPVSTATARLEEWAGVGSAERILNYGCGRGHAPGGRLGVWYVGRGRVHLNRRPVRT